MRVTENTNYDTIRDNIHRSKEKMENLQRQSATMRKLSQPSDDPIGASKVLELRTDKVNNDQFQMNAKMAETFLENTDHAVADLSEIILRAKEIALNQSSAASSSEDTRLGVAEEVTQLFKQAVSTGNRRVGDRYIFGGFKTQKPPVDPEGEYLGDDGQMMLEIAGGVFLSMNIPGIDVFNTHPKLSNAGGYGEESQRSNDDGTEENVNVFDELQNFRIALLTGNVDAVHGTLDRFDQIFGKLVATRSKLGSRISGLQSTSQAIERHNVTNAMLSSSIEDADMAQVMSDLSKEETVFRSSLATSKRLIQPTLLDFLK
jgi:flagellar hook-associated protein 3 FlgL